MPPKKKAGKTQTKKKKEDTDHSEEDTVKEDDSVIEDVDEDQDEENGDGEGGEVVDDEEADGAELNDDGEKIEHVPMHEQFGRKPNHQRENYVKDMKKILKQSVGKERKDPPSEKIEYISKVPYDLCDPEVFYKFRVLVEKVRGNKHAEKTLNVYRVMDAILR